MKTVEAFPPTAAEVAVVVMSGRSTLAMSEASTLPARVGSDDAQDASSATAEDASPYASPQLFTAQMPSTRWRCGCGTSAWSLKRLSAAIRTSGSSSPVRCVLDVGRGCRRDFVDEIQGFNRFR